MNSKINNYNNEYERTTISEVFELIYLIILYIIKKIRRINKKICRKYFKKEIRLHNYIIGTLCILIMVYSVLFFSANKANADDGTKKTEYKYFTQITVEEGDSLWGIANKYKGDNTSVSDELAEIKHINNLRSDNIMEGQKIVVPYYSYEYK